ncbi:ATPase family AAA domain-containing protein [Vespula squamosa]|uniref:Pseudouridylate synthase 1 homolog n=1 Tax=Vespula squamosa TaxID=30214 RepID=A0ABD2AXF6_VESSQ
MSIEIETVSPDPSLNNSNKKRLRVDEDEDNVVKIQKVDVVKIKKRPYALMMGYLGRDYYGMQINPGMKTIEDDLLNALLKNNLITTENIENLRSFNFQRAARTDKGVSAARQVVSLKLPETVSKDSINDCLPNEIRVFGIKRVTKGFNSKINCSSRTYRYIIPTFAFAEEDKASLPSREECDVEKRMEELLIIKGKPYTDFRLNSETLEKINLFMKLFQGTHNFHNFTSKVKPLDPRAKRYIIKFQCVETFVSENIEFAVIEIKGQSFMLHQIRKMVSMVIAFLRNMATEDSLKQAFKDEKMDIPLAPSLGLSLNYVHYDHYNNRYGSDGIHEPLDWKECEEEVEKFQSEYIVKHIVNTEVAEKTAGNFQCYNGDCIASELLCDGEPNCKDQSDETQSECSKPQLLCSPYAFRCNYGACIDGDLTCNGIRNCIDNSDETLAACSGSLHNTTNTVQCSINQFKCNNGQCIDSVRVCDGNVDCRDRSDETSSICGSLNCDPFLFRCYYGACIDGDLKCNGIINCADGSDEDIQLCSTTTTTTTIPFIPPTRSTTSTLPPWTPQQSNRCLVPPQPANGKRQLHKSQCQTQENCDVQEGVELYRGAYLVYTCNPGYKISGSSDIFCGPEGKWLNIPVCSEIRCKSLASASTNAECTYNGQWTTCESPVLPGTMAKLNCHNSYREDTLFLSRQRSEVICNERGQWEPEPLQCIPGPLVINVHIGGGSVTLQTSNEQNHSLSPVIEVLPDKIIIYADTHSPNNSEIDVRILNSNKASKETDESRHFLTINFVHLSKFCIIILISIHVLVCGVVTPNAKPLIVYGNAANISLFPWHATIYETKSSDGPKEFICGATIIKENFLITAAHCVFDETNNRVNDPKRYYIATGNIFRDYDYPDHDPRFVKKAKVKSIYVNCNYLGLEGNYAWDIALLEIDVPFVFSALLLPACLDQSFIESGEGVVAGFGRTALGPSSFILQSVTLPYVPLNQCRSAGNTVQSEKFITIDKFCAGYTNGTSVCDGDSGGGLVFKTGNLWFLRGIVSIGLGETLSGGIRSCDSHSYSLYTRISSHISWIQDITFKIETSKPIPLCRSSSSYTFA